MPYSKFLKYAVLTLAIVVNPSYCWSSSERPLPEVFADVYQSNITYPPFATQEIELFEVAEAELFNILSDAPLEKEKALENLQLFLEKNNKNSVITVVERLCRWYFSQITEKSPSAHKRNYFNLVQISCENLSDKLEGKFLRMQTLLGLCYIHSYDEDPQVDRISREINIYNAFFNSYRAKEIQGIIYFLHCLEVGNLTKIPANILTTELYNKLKCGCVMEAAELGDVNAMRDWGDALIDDPLGNLGSKREGLRWLKKAAGLGDFVAMNNLGLSELQGVGLDPGSREKNASKKIRLEKAVQLIIKAAENGVPGALQNLANFYISKTVGAELTDEERIKMSFQYRLKAYEAGDLNAKTGLLASYLYNVYCPDVNQEEREYKAIAILEDLIEKETRVASGEVLVDYCNYEVALDGRYMFFLANFLISNKGQIQLTKAEREVRAWKLLNIAAGKLQHAGAMHALAECLFYNKLQACNFLPDNMRINKAIEWLEKAHAKGNQKASVWLYRIYSKGHNHIAKDDQKALSYLRKIAEKQDQELQDLLNLRTGDVNAALATIQGRVLTPEIQEIVDLLKSNAESLRREKKNKKKKKTSVGALLAEKMLFEAEKMRNEALDMAAELVSFMEDDDSYEELLAGLRKEMEFFSRQYFESDEKVTKRELAADILGKIQKIKIQFLLAKAERLKLTELEISIEQQVQRDNIPEYMRGNSDPNQERREEQRRIKQMAKAHIEKERRDAHLRRTKPGSKGPIVEKSKPLEMEPVELIQPYNNIGINFNLDASLQDHYQAKLNEIRDAIRHAHGEHLGEVMNTIVFNLRELPGDYDFKVSVKTTPRFNSRSV